MHRAIEAVLLTAMCSACASYNERTYVALDQFESGRFAESIVSYREADVTESRFLKGAESGLAAFVAGRWEQARTFFSQAAQEVEDIEEEALISPQSAAKTIASWTINESFTDYFGEGYERVMLHSCLGLSYLALGQVEDLLVEVRRTNALLEVEEELYDTEYGAGGLGHFISAIGYELLGNADDAYIDYKRMESKGLGGGLVGSALVRLASQLHREDELAQWEDQFGARQAPSPDAARIVVIAGLGAGPLKREGRMDIMTRSGILTWTVPQIMHRSQAVSHLTLEVANLQARVKTAEIEDVTSIRTRNLEDRLAWLATKSTVRTFLKRELRRNLKDKHGEWAGLAGDLFNAATERADLRTWGTLPSSWHAASIFLPPGSHDLVLTAAGQPSKSLGRFELAPGETMFVMARTLRRRLFAHAIGGNPVPLTPPSAEASTDA